MQRRREVTETERHRDESKDLTSRSFRLLLQKVSHRVKMALSSFCSFSRIGWVVPALSIELATNNKIQLSGGKYCQGGISNTITNTI